MNAEKHLTREETIKIVEHLFARLDTVSDTSPAASFEFSLAMIHALLADEISVEAAIQEISEFLERHETNASGVVVH